jgi:aryl-alcohol dehydrogenase-like predicted oxidoreductase
MNGLIKAPLGYGSLTGKYNSESKIDKNHLLSNWDFSTERRKNIYASVIRAKKLFFEEGKTLVQGLLHWILQQSPNVIPIPGAKTLEQLEENSEVLTQKPLSQDCLKQIDKIFIDSRLP